MSVNTWPFADTIQRLAAPVVRAISMSEQSGVLISTDRRNSFLGLLLQCCAAGASKRLQTVFTRDGSAGLELSNVEGLTLGAPQRALAGQGHMRPRQAFSLDRYAAPCGKVFAIALDADAVAGRIWRGARSTILRDRPIFVAYAQGRSGVLAELAADDYVVQDILYWTSPEAVPMIAMAVPRERMQAEGGFHPPLVGLPDTIAASFGVAGASALKTLFRPHDFETEVGFYHPEGDEKDHSWIWTGPGREARMVLPTPWLGSGALRIGFERSDQGNDDLNSVEVRINNRAVVKQVDGMSLRVPITLGINEFSGAHTMSIINQHMTPCPYESGRWLGLCVNHVALEWF